MSGDFLGAGWAFPVDVDEHGQIRAADHDQLVRQSIWSILSTTPGERVMRPTFGSGLAELVFAPNGPLTGGLAASHVRRALVEFEPRIDVLDVAVSTDDADPGRLLIEVDYQVRATNSRFNLVYPFYVA